MANLMLFRALTLDGRTYGELFNSCEEVAPELCERLNAHSNNSVSYKPVSVKGKLPEVWVNGHCPPAYYSNAHLEFIKFVQGATETHYTPLYVTNHRYGTTYTYLDRSTFMQRNDGTIKLRVPNGTIQGFTMDTRLPTP